MHLNLHHLVLPVAQPLDPQGDHHRVPRRADLDSAHNKDHHQEDRDLVALSSSKDQREGLRRDPSRVAQEDLVLNSPYKDLWVGRHLHREGLAAHPQEVRAYLDGQNKTSRSSWGLVAWNSLCPQ